MVGVEGCGGGQGTFIAISCPWFVEGVWERGGVWGTGGEVCFGWSSGKREGGIALSKSLIHKYIQILSSLKQRNIQPRIERHFHPLSPDSDFASHALNRQLKCQFLHQQQ